DYRSTIQNRTKKGRISSPQQSSSYDVTVVTYNDTAAVPTRQVSEDGVRSRPMDMNNIRIRSLDMPSHRRAYRSPGNSREGSDSRYIYPVNVFYDCRPAFVCNNDVR